MLLLSSSVFSKLTVSNGSFRKTIRESNVLDPDLGPDLSRRSVGPVLGPNCLQSFSAEDNFKPK